MCCVFYRREQYTKHLDQNQVRKVRFPNWSWRESNPGPGDIIAHTLHLWAIKVDVVVPKSYPVGTYINIASRWKPRDPEQLNNTSYKQNKQNKIYKSGYKIKQPIKERRN